MDTTRVDKKMKGHFLRAICHLNSLIQERSLFKAISRLDSIIE